MGEELNLWCTLAGGAVVKSLALMYITFTHRKKYVGKVSRLFVFPVKSVRELNGGSLPEVTLTKHGVKFGEFGDRHWMVTKDGDMLTMRQNARLTLITSQVKDGQLCLEAAGMDPLVLSLDPEVTEDNQVTVTVKKTPLPAIDLGNDASRWVSTVTQTDDARLNYSVPGLSKRLSSSVIKDWPTQVDPNDEVVFQDFVQCMVMTESSLDELNKRLEDPVGVINFRPNIMVEGSCPFDEDSWQEVYIGDTAKLRFVDKCTRCLLTTIDPETALADPNSQPLTELKQFRCMEPYGAKPCFGIHTSVDVEGPVRIGDLVYVVRK